MDGMVVSTVAMVWLQVLVLPQASVATQMRVATKVLPQVRLVNVLRTVILFVPQVSLAVGVPKSSAVPHSLVWLAGQKVKVGLVVSTVAIVWLQVLVRQVLGVTKTLVWSVGPTMEAEEEPIVHRIVEPGGGASM